MRHFVNLTIALLMVLLFSCSDGDQSSSNESSVPENSKELATNSDMVELDVELYCKIRNELRALLMDEYWDQIKNKPFDEVKDIYLEYNIKEDAIYEKYGIDDPLDMGNFFRSNFAAIEEYQKTNPEYTEYPEWTDAKNTLGSLAIRMAAED